MKKNMCETTGQLNKETKVHHIFEVISGKYDLMNNVISLFLHKKWRRNALEEIRMEKGSRVIDLCCGTGVWTVDLAHQVGREGMVYGIDFSKAMLNLAGEKLFFSGLDNVSLLYGNIKSIPFAEGFFDYATLGFGLRNVSGTRVALSEIQRVLKPGGKLLCLETSKPSSPLLRHLYYLYLRYLVPFLGFVLAKRFKEFRYLQESTWLFPEKDELVLIFCEAGFEDITVTEFIYGVVTMYTMVKGKRNI